LQDTVAALADEYHSNVANLLNLEYVRPFNRNKGVFAMSFISERDRGTSDSLVFVFRGQKLLVKGPTKSVRIITGAEIEDLGIRHSKPLYLGELKGRSCFCSQAEASSEPEKDSGFYNLRGLFGSLDEDLFRMASLALQVSNWDRVSGYCGNCGDKLFLAETERAKECRACGRVVYPRISPAVIMSVVRDGEILLARSTRFKKSFYSVLAGYVEVGENLEECVRREVYEEVGLRVKNIRYFGSQSWPFSNSLMIAFTCEYESGTIRIDQDEICEAGWFAPDGLPDLPGRGSISRQLVDFFASRVSGGL
jgi:NAD+ diphosphatase